MLTSDEKPVLKADAPATISVSGSQAPTDNHVYFYEPVTETSIMTLLRQLKDVDVRLRTERIQRDLPDDFIIPIKLHVRSPGGYVFDGMNAYDHIKQSRTPIWTYVEGYAASAATFITCAGSKRFIMPNAYMLIHQFSTIVWGTYEQFKDDQKLNDDMIERMRQIYVANSKMKYEKVTKLLKHDSWFNSAEAVKLGLVDEIFV